MARLDQVRVLAHPLRLRLYELFAQGPRTTKQAALELGQPVTRLYHHVAALERVGLLKLRETRPIRGTVEKYFGIATHQVAIEARALTGSASGRARRIRGALADAVRGGVVATMFERAREESLAALATAGADSDPELLPVLARAVFRLTDVQVPKARKAVVGLLKRLVRVARRRAPQKATSRWALTLAFVPTGTEVKSRKGGRRPRP